MVVAPRSWFRDRVTHFPRADVANRDATGFVPSVSQELRCKFHAAGTLSWTEGRQRLEGTAYMLLRKLPGTVRQIERIEERVVPPRAVGDRLPLHGYPVPGVGLFPPVEVFRADLVPVLTEYHTFGIHSGDTVQFNNNTYVVTRWEEFDGWNGPSHVKVMLEDSR